MNEREWYNTELDKKQAEEFREWLHENQILFEPSEVDEFVHFELLLNIHEAHLVAKFLQELKKKKK